MRQKLRYEHFEDKRKLKVRAIENVIVTCNQKSSEGQMAQALMAEVRGS